MWKVIRWYVLLIQITNGQLVGQTRIVGGQPRRVIPWMASLTVNGNSFCGGALITSKAVVTAAHCFEGFDPRQMRLMVILGRGTDRKEMIEVNHVFVHERFTMNLFKYDVAVVRLKHHARTNFFAQIVSKRDYDRVKVAGWGLLEYHGPKPGSMQQANVVIEPDHVCLAKMKFDPSLSFCARGFQYEETPCTGDSGGPLFKGANMLIGTVSFGKRCHGVAIYAKLTSFTNWIYDKAKTKNFR